MICVGDEYGQRNLARFVLRLKKVALAGGEEHVCKKVQVKVSTKAFIEEATFHLQDKHGHRAVAELRLRGLTRPGLPIPRHYLVTQVDSVRKNFLDYFEQEWASAKLVTTKDLLALVDRRQTEDQAYEKVRRELLSEVVD